MKVPGLFHTMKCQPTSTKLKQGRLIGWATVPTRLHTPASPGAIGVLCWEQDASRETGHWFLLSATNGCIAPSVAVGWRSRDASAVPASFQGALLQLVPKMFDHVRGLIRDVATLIGIFDQVVQFRLAVPVEDQLVGFRAE